MPALALCVCMWLFASIAWSALVFVAAKLFSRGREDWSSYWLAALVVAVAPSLTAPVWAVAPTPISMLQIETALAVVDFTAPLQRAGFNDAVMLPALLITVLLALGALQALGHVALQLKRAADVTGESQDAPHELQREGARVLIGGASSAFCLGGPRPSIVLPEAMALRMTPAQLRLVIDHELAHLRRGDPTLFAALRFLEALYWFNPIIARLAERVRLAAEIECDAAAHAGDAAARLDYAQIYVSALERGQADPALATFGGRAGALRARLQSILRGQVRPRHIVVSVALLSCAALFSLGGAAAATTTARMSVFGDSMLLSALQARAARVYGAPQCGPDGLSATSMWGIGDE